MKYELTEEVIEQSRLRLFRIRALKDFGTVSEGDLGGFVEKEENLSQDGNAWIYDNEQIMWISKIGSRLGTTTIFRNKDNGLGVNSGCFYGTLEEFENQVGKTHGETKFGKEYKLLIELIKVHFELEK